MSRAALWTMVLIVVLLLLCLPLSGHTATFTVNSTTDAVDAIPGNGVCATAGGVCTLRAAIQETNILAGADIINLPAGTYTLTLTGFNENAAASGDLDITGTVGVTINGGGQGATIIDGNGTDRVFDVSVGSNTFTDLTIRNGNAGSSSGGGIYYAVPSTTTQALTRVTVTGNTNTSQGPGIYLSANTTCNITDSVISNNSTTNGGGGIDSSGTLTIDNTTISGNSGTAGGGVNNGGTMTMNNSVINNNTASTSGGGIHNSPGTATLTNVTISANTSPTGGGINFKGTLNLTNSTIYGNITGRGIEKIAGAATTSFKNTIIAGNAAGNCSTTFTSAGYNLESATNTCGFTGTGDQNTVTVGNLNIGPLASNGGPTQTHALSAGSFAIDKIANGTNECGTTVTTDQRGIARPQNVTCDVGAYEFQGLCPGGVVTTTADSGAGSLRECINYANGLPATTISFNIPGPGNQSSDGDSWWRISPASALPTITGAGTVIDGTTQTTNRGNTNTKGPEIEINGASAGAGVAGLRIIGAANTTIRELVVNGFSTYGIGFGGAVTGTKLYGNYLGTNATGDTAVPNLDGIFCVTNPSNVDIGGPNAGEGNLISGNTSSGITLGNANNIRIYGNKIGTDRTATAKVPNLRGIYVMNGTNTATIGGSMLGQGNIVSGNTYGIWVTGLTASGITVRGNTIGSGVTGMENLGNVGQGIYLDSSAVPTNIVIGGSSSGDGNLLANNGNTGISAINSRTGGFTAIGNTIRNNAAAGVDSDWDNAVIAANLIYQNGTGSTKYDGIILRANGDVAKIFQNTIHGNGKSGIAAAGTNAVIRNNIITGSLTSYGINVTGTLSESYNLITDASTTPANALGRSNVALDATDLNANPLYTNSGTGDFTLQSSSPAINRGVDLVADQPDMNGASAGNFNGYAPDMGYWESPITTTCPVSSTADSGAGTLRACITYANGIPGTTVSFSISTGDSGYQTSGSDHWWRIAPVSTLPSINAANTVIDGTTQTTLIGDTNSKGPEIEIHGASAPTNTNGIRIDNVANVTVKGIVVNGFRTGARGISIGGSNARIHGCYIGTDAIGITAVANQGIGILLGTGATGNDIGGLNAGEGNLIAGNSQTAIYINSANDNRIRGNKIGTDRTGTVKIGNGNQGVELVGTTSGTIIGGSTAGAGNIIAGVGSGVHMLGTSSSNTVQGNIIGSGVTGTETGLNNGTGIYINSTAAATNNLIGGLNPGEGNLIAFSTYDGINVANTGSGDRIQGNTIRSNQDSGIRVSDTGLVISKNLILYNNWAGINAAGANTQIFHNTIHGQTGASGHGILVSATGAVIRNNIITGNSGYGINRIAASMTEGHNLVTDASTTPANASGRSNVALDVSDRNLDPNYLNEAGDNFTLTECFSPAINAGVNLGVDQPDMNGAGAGNWTGILPDMGALESSCSGANDIAIGDGFSDWDNGSGNEFCLNDQGGANDWTSPAKLDITKYCIGSNLSDRFFVLFGFDDPSFANDATACVLLDTDATPDNNINQAFCVTVNGTSVASLTLFNCDNSIAGGCGGSTVAKTYNPADYAIGTATGPFGGSDTFVEAQLPYADIGVALGNIVFTSLVSYPGAALLKSPKDSIFGTGGKQNYNDRLQYDTAGIGSIQDNALIPSVSGNVYTDEGVTSIGSGKTVRLLRNGANGGTNTTDTGGGYYIQNAGLAAGEAILVYIDGDGTYKGTTASVYPGNHLSELDIYAAHLIVRHDNTGSLTNALLNTAKGGSGDTDILYAISGSNLTVTGSGTELYLPADHSFAPGGAVTTPHLKSLGTLTGGSSAFDIAGDLTIGGGTYTASSAATAVSGNLALSAGSFAHNGGTVVFDGTGQAITGSLTFHNLTKSVASADTLTIAAGSTATVNGTCTLNGASGQLLSLRSSSSPTKWNFVLGASSTKAISYVDVKDSDASGSHATKIPVTPTSSVDSGATVSWFGTPMLTVIKSADTAAANPGQVITYTVQVSNTGNGLALNVVLDDHLSPFSAWSLDAFGAGIAFEFTDGAPASGLTLGSASYSNNNASTWVYTPASTGGGAPSGYDGNVTNWKIPMTGNMNAGADFTLKYKVRVK